MLFHALVLVSTLQQHTYNEPLTAWGREAGFQHWYYGWPEDGYTVSISNVAPCRPPQLQSLHRLTHGVRAQSMSCVRVSLDHAMYCPYWLDEAECAAVPLEQDGVQRSAGDVLDSWGVTNRPLDLIPCV